MFKCLCQELSYSPEPKNYLVSTQAQEEKGCYVELCKDQYLSAVEKQFWSPWVCCRHRGIKSLEAQLQVLCPHMISVQFISCTGP